MTHLLNWISDWIVRYRQRQWRRQQRRNRVRYSTAASIGPRLRLESGKYLRGAR